MKDEGRGWAKDEGERRKAEGDTPQSKIQNPKSKILLADDNADMRRSIQQLLSGGYEVHEAGDGEAALAVARENPPDLVLADVMMPRLDGFGLLQALRGDLRTRSIPVILMAEHGGEVWRREVLEAGANDCLIKPFSGGELRARVSARLEIALLHREALEREHKLCVLARNAEAEAARKNDMLRRLRNALQRELASRTDDISQLTQERKRAEEELRRANAKITEILESITDGFSAWDQNWRYIYANERSAQLLGKPKEQLIGRSVWDFFPEAVGTEAYLKCQQAMAERLPVHFEACFYNRWYENHVYPTKEGLSIYWREITDRKRAEEALRASSRRIENILESITDEFNAFDREWRFTYLNQAALNSIRRAKGEELTLEQVLGKKVWEMFPAHVGSVVYQKYHDAMREQKAMEFEARSPVTDRWIEGRVYPSQEGLSVYYRDITERKRVEERLAYHAYLLENVHDAIIATDERLAVTAWNKGAEQMYGWRADEARGRYIWEVVPVELSDEQRAEALRELEERGRFRTEAVTYRKDGTPVHVEGITIALQGEQEESQITGYVNIRRDITDRKRAEEALRASSRRIENILEGITDQFYAMDCEWRFTYINERALGYIQRAKGKDLTRQDLLGKNVWELYPELVGSVYYQKYHEALREQKTVHFEVYYPPNDTWGEMHAYPSEEGLSVYWQNITERKRAEEKLRRSEGYLAEAQRVSHTGSWAWNISTGECFWSLEHFRIFGLDPDNFKTTKETTQRLIHSEDLPFVEQTLEKAVRDRSDFELDYRIVRPDGSTRYHRGVGHPVVNESGELEFIGTVVDVTESKLAEEQLRRSEAFLAEGQTISHTGSWAVKFPSEEVFWSQEIFRIYGIEAATKPSQEIAFQVIHPEDRQFVRKAFERAVRDQSDFAVEHRALLADGSIKHLHALGHPVLNESGDLVEYVGTVMDITERKQAEEHLTYQAKLLASIHDAVFATDDQLVLTAWNRAAEEIYGWKAEEVLGRKVQDVVRSQFTATQRSEAIRALAETGHYHTEVVHYHRDGRQLWIEGDAMVLRNETGRMTGYVTACRDITERKRTEEELRKAQTQLAHAMRVTMMGELAASIAHEINGPLGSIVNNGNACLRLIGAGPEAQDEAREALADIVADAERAGAIIARIRALVQRSQTERVPLQLTDVLGEALALARRELIEQRITVCNEVPEDLSKVWGDRVQLQEVFHNLIINAVDAMSAVEDDRRLLIMRGRPDTLENRPAVLISVEDRGASFRPEDSERLFKAFFTTKRHGMGMGLRISRSIVEAHGGRLWATLNDGQGATFHFALPVGKSDETG